MTKKEYQQNDVAGMRLLGKDLAPRWREIFGDISVAYKFVPDWERVKQSGWWKTGKIGAVIIPGAIGDSLERRPAVLKIQGTKPVTSEDYMIKEFSKQNKSKVIRPPKVYAHIPWDEEKQYEALITEGSLGKPVILHHPAMQDEFQRFFGLYEEYREKCFSEPWVARPVEWSYGMQVQKWMGAVAEQAKQDLFTEKEDYELTQEGVEIIEREYSVADLEFMHGHFGAGDLIVNQEDVVLLSNLFWSWRVPYYDLVFHYHWWMLGMEHAEPFSEEILEKERERWLSRIYSMDSVTQRAEGERLVTLALLERAVPALMVDRYMMDPEKPSYGIITRATRKELKRLIRELT